MANTRFTQFYYTKHAMPILLDCNFDVGATGAVGTVKGPGIAGITRLSTGCYKVHFQDNYYKFYGADWSIQAPVTGSNVAPADVSVGTVYQITGLGNTTAASWLTLGVPPGITPAVGVAFKALAAGTGTATVKAIGSSGIAAVEIVGTTNTELAPIGQYGSNAGGYAIVQCMAPIITMASYTPAGTNSAPALTMASYTPAGTNNSSTPPIFTGTPAVLTGTVAAPVFTGTPAVLTGTVTYTATDPAQNSQLYLQFYLSNSSVIQQGE